MEELAIQSHRLIKDHLLSGKLSPHSLEISNKMLQHVKNARQWYESHKQQNAKDEQKRIVELEIKDIEGQIQDLQIIITGLEEKFFAFVEDSEKKTIFQYYLQQTLLRRRLRKRSKM